MVIHSILWTLTKTQQCRKTTVGITHFDEKKLMEEVEPSDESMRRMDGGMNESLGVVTNCTDSDTYIASKIDDRMKDNDMRSSGHDFVAKR
jgi:hypothetical protein